MPDGAGAYPAYKQYLPVGRIRCSRRYPAVTKQYSSVGRIRRFTSPSGSHKTVPVRRPDKTFHVAIRQSQNSTRP
ncbi:hypothetical protein BIX13_12495 [Salmonella enterica]|nr:hypothetical protein [Salmonella enterica]EBR4351591.1 hypothetical protein [Salmonella enterica]ECC4543189.1 hypothetical protein [Salmonella enterica]ECL1682829.1 hypothetical protein [Salmonella enterica]EEE1142589.1 hypothetical protein [Salmonella enterica]